jgi:hypothetical protein
VLRRLREEEHKFKASLGCIAPVSTNQKNLKKYLYFLTWYFTSRIYPIE